MKEKLFIGGYSNSIKVCEFDNGFLKIVNEVKDIENPSYLNINNNILYAISETKLGAVLSFKIEDINLKKINSKILNESLPCYVSTNRSGTKLLTANFGSGSISMYELENGIIGKELVNKKYENSHMHYADFANNAIYGIDLANDVIYIYNENMDTIYTIKTQINYGPRHAIMFDKYIFVVTELSNKILLYKIEDNDYKLIQEISTLKNENITSYAGAIKMSSDHKYIYVTNRGENTISVFSFFDEKLRLVQNISCFGDFPRDITLNENEDFAVVANQKSNNLVVFKRNLENGNLEKLNDTDFFIEKPSCIVRSKYEI